MTNLQQIFLIISTIAGLITSIFAIYSVFVGMYKPQRMTRLIFLIINSVIFFSLMFLGNQTAVWLVGTQFLTSVILVILSLKYGIGGKSKSDLLVLFLAVITIIIWQTTKDSFLALNLSIMVHLIGISPTISKCFKLPYTEEPKLYFLDLIAGLFSILALPVIFSTQIIYPLYILFINVLCLLLIYFGKKYKINNNSKLIT
jgi:hypothetical protein